MRDRGDIEMRIGLGEWIIESIKNDPDSRRDQAIAHLREQIETLRVELAALSPVEVQATPTPEGKPKDQVIGLKTLSMKSQIGGQNG